MTSSLPWKFHSLSCAPTFVLGLRVPIKRDSQLSISTGHSWVLKLLSSAASPLRKPLFHQHHEALRDCPVSPHASSCLLLSSALSTKFQTKRGKQVCADPSETWVQEYVYDLELN
ncbi:uncharacterized protein [Gorilla gorilla gorilla]|uniref:uncharacterized protein isoform X1 n=1 Tax=Gorilla gorilla gorilla TaxID=9595 RepID=UPI00123ECAAE|nr:uncharacterized protein LOC101140367 isoform X1 [Gorilla gorilla gorilla]